MSSEEGHISAQAEQVLEGPITRGRKDRRSPTRRSKSKGPDAREHVETRLANLEQSLEDVQHTVEELGDNYEELIQENVEISAATKELVADLGKTFQKDLKELSSTVTTLKTFVEGELRELYSKYISLDAKVDTLCMECRSKHFGGDGPSTSTHAAVQGTTHIKVPKPDTYNGVRNATVVENFLFGLDRYYVAVGVRDDEAKINNAPTFLRDAAQLWWRRRYADQNGNAIQTWEQFKAELRKHFVPHNAEMESRAKLRRLRHTGNILDYVKEFTTIMLEISDLPEKEALFQFRDGLKDWAKVELDRRNVQTLDDAIAAAEMLIDYTTQSKERKPSPSKREGNHYKHRDSEQKEKGKKAFQRHGKYHKTQQGESSKPSPCFVCNGPHRTRDCPNRKAMNALVAKLLESKQGDDTPQIGSLQHIGALKQANQTTKGGLLHGNVKINGREAIAMFDTGASHNFMNVNEAKRIGLKFTNEEGTVKAVNSEAQAIKGVARGVTVKIGDWQGKLDFTVLPMDDFDIVLGLGFFDRVIAIVDSSGCTLTIVDGQITTIPLKKGKPTIRLSAMLNKEGVAETQHQTVPSRETNSKPTVPTEHKDVMLEAKSGNADAVNNVVSQKAKLAAITTSMSRSDFLNRIKERHEECDISRACLAKAATKMKKWADRKRRAREYQVGEKVMVKLLPNQFKSLRKVHKGLIRRYEGPFSIIEKVGKAAYRLELPPRLKIHNVFHVSMLKPFYEDKEDPSRGESSRAPTGMISEFDRKIKEILAERKIRRRGVPSYNEYLIAWEGLPESEASWEKEDTLWQFQDEIRRFQESATGTLRNRVGEGVTPQK